jgi:hypothetical protein
MLTVTTVVYALAVGLAGWADLQQGVVILPAFYPYGDTTVLLPAAVLLLAGLGSLVAEGARRLRPRT